MGNSKLPRGLRNNNPGNIRKSSILWSGEIPNASDPEFCVFVSMPFGYRAIMKTLCTYRKKHGLKTIDEMIQRWAPASENNTAAYVRSVCRDLQVPSSFVIDIDDRDSMCALTAAITKQENGVDAVMEDVHRGWNLLNI